MTYNQIKLLFEAISQAYPQIKTCEFGDPPSKVDTNTIQTIYPAFFQVVNDSAVRDQTVEWDITLTICDLVQNDNSNLNDVISDCDLIVKGIIKILKNNDIGYFILNDPIISHFKDRYGDKVAGATVNITLETDNTIGTCDVPFEPFSFSYDNGTWATQSGSNFKCSELLDCGVFNNLTSLAESKQDNLSIATGQILYGTSSVGVTSSNRFKWDYIDNTLNIIGSQSITSGGLNLNTGSIINIADGINNKDAINVSQLNSATTSLTNNLNTFITQVNVSTSSIISTINNLTTTQVPEGTNLYYTQTRVSDYIDSIKGVPNGIPSLAANGQIPSSQIPILFSTETYIIGSSASLTGLTAAERGDIAIATVSNKSYILQGNTYSTYTNWVELSSSSTITSVNGQIGNVLLTTSDINEGSNLYYTDQRAKTANAQTANQVVYGTGGGLTSSSNLTISGNSLSLNDNKIINVATGSNPLDAINYNQLSLATSSVYNSLVMPANQIVYSNGTGLTSSSRITISGTSLSLNQNKIINVATGSNSLDAVNVGQLNLATNITPQYVAYGSPTGGLTTSTILYFGEVSAGGNAYLNSISSAGTLTWGGVSGEHFFQSNSGYVAHYYAQARYNGKMFVGSATTVPTATLDLIGSTSALSSLRIRAGVTVSSPNNGEFYNNAGTVNLNAALTINGTVSASSNKIINVATGSNPLDAVNYGQLTALNRITPTEIVYGSSAQGLTSSNRLYTEFDPSFNRTWIKSPNGTKYIYQYCDNTSTVLEGSSLQINGGPNLNLRSDAGGGYVGMYAGAGSAVSFLRMETTGLRLGSTPVATAFITDNIFTISSGKSFFGANATASAIVDISGGLTSSASLRLRQGTAPLSPNDGDFWNNAGTININSALTINGTVSSNNNKIINVATGSNPLDAVNYGQLLSMSGGSGLTNLNGLTQSSQTFTASNAGNNFHVVSSGTVHTFNFPTASTTNTGKLSTTDWNTFNNKQGNLSIPSGQILFGTGGTGVTSSSRFSYDHLNQGRLSIGGDFSPTTNQVGTLNVKVASGNGGVYVAGVPGGTFLAWLRNDTAAMRAAMNLETNDDMVFYRATGAVGAHVFTRTLKISNSTGNVGIGAFNASPNSPFTVLGNSFFGGDTASTAFVDIAGGSTGTASFRLRQGSTPTTPNNGDMWNIGGTINVNSALTILGTVSSNSNKIINVATGSNPLDAVNYGQLNRYLSGTVSTNQIPFGYNTGAKDLNASSTFTYDSAEMKLTGGIRLQVRQQSADYTLDSSDYATHVLVSGVRITLPLGSSATLGKLYVCKMASTTAGNTCILKCNVADNIDGLTQLTLTAIGGTAGTKNSVTVCWDGTRWNIHSAYYN